MSFATLQEAWGLPSFDAPPLPPPHRRAHPTAGHDNRHALPGHGLPGAAPAHFSFGEDHQGYQGHHAPPPGHRRHERRKKRERTPFSRLRKPESSSRRPVGFASEFAPAPQLAPLRADDELALQSARRFLATTYARYGLPGLIRLLPPEASHELRKGRGRSGGHGGGAHGLRKLWDELLTFLSSPEKLLMVLLCIFVLFVAWDNYHAQQAVARSAATLASMAPLPAFT